MLDATARLSTIDYAVILGYLVATLALGAYIGRRMKTGADFFLAGRRLPWWAIGMSLVATDIGATDIIGVGGAAYSHGMAVANFEWIGCVPAMIVAAFVFVPFFYRSGVYTVPEFLERRYNAGVRTVLALCWTVFMACNLGIMLVASAKMMSALFGWDPTTCVWATALIVGFYSCAGGLAAVVYTDVIQCAVMIGGCLLVLVLGLVQVGGVSGLRDRLEVAEARQVVAAVEATPVAPAVGEADDDAPPDAAPESRRMDLILPVDTATPFPWPAIFFGLALILSPAYWIGNQAIVQRSLGARSEFEAKASYIWGALLKNVIPLIVAVPGLIALALYPDLSDGDLAFPHLVNRLLPMGLRGVFVAAFLAALMSSVDSYLNSAATIVSHDLYKRFVNPSVSPERLLTVGRVTTLVLVAWGIAFALALTRLEEGSGLYAIFQTLMAFFQGPALAVLLLGVLWRRATGAAALVGLLAGIATSVSLYLLNQPSIVGALGIRPLFQVGEPFLYFSVWAFLVTAMLTIVLSFATRPEPPEKLVYVLRLRRPARAASDPSRGPDA